MSELLQSGHHPDADQLNAFVEHTLPPHEQQQTLAHLAICADCRSIVSLSLPPVDESPTLQPELVRKRWFSGWNLAWPVAAALAALVVILYVRNAASTRSSTARTQMAISQPHVSLPVPEASTIPAPTSPPLSSEQRQSSSRPRAAIGAAKAPNPQKTDDVTDTQSITTLPMQNRNSGGIAQHRPGLSLGDTNSPLHGSIGDAAKRSSMSAGMAPANTPAGSALDRLQQNTSGTAAVNLGNQPSAASPAPAPPLTFREADAKAASPPVAPSAAPIDTASQTVAVTNAAPIVPLSSVSNDMVPSIPEQRLLPSNLPVLSVASTVHRTLAIDTQNALFLSDDDGKHWKAIPSQWQGHAIKVDLVSAPNILRRSSANASGTPQPGAVFGAIAGPISSNARATSSTLAGTVADASGAVIPGASVVVSDATTPVVHTATTDGAGRYRVDDLVPGSYQVAAEAPGFNKQQLAVTLTASQQSLANITLPVGQSSEAVTVNASAMQSESRSLAKRKISESQSATSQPLPLFEITTDTGEHWTSIDGQTWKRK
jgi:hypothetical protein